VLATKHLLQWLLGAGLLPVVLACALLAKSGAANGQAFEPGEAPPVAEAAATSEAETANGETDKADAIVPETDDKKTGDSNSTTSAAESQPNSSASAAPKTDLPKPDPIEPAPARTDEVPDGGTDSAKTSTAVSPLVSRLSGKLEDVGPDTFILLDAEGNPQPVLNMGWEDFFAAWQQQQALSTTATDSSTKYTLEECELVGTLESNYATVTATFTIKLHTSEPTDVPLGFSGAILRKLPDSPTNLNGRFLTRNPDQGGYAASLLGEPGDVKTVELELWTPIRREGDRATLRLLTPRANTNTVLLVSRDTLRSITASEGALLTTKTLLAGNSRIEAEHGGGELSLRWQDARRPTGQFDSVLTAKGKIFATIDGSSVRTQAQLTVQSFGRPFKQFIVRLPRGAEPIPVEWPDVVESIEPIGSGEETGEIEELQVTLKAEQLDPVTLTLETKQPFSSNGDRLDIELTGFEVVGAVGQDGEVGIQVDKGWQLRPALSDSIEQVDTQDLDLSWQTPAVTADNIDMALEYVRQPWSLPVQLTPRVQRAVATPSYKLTIGPSEALLEMRISYQVSGTGSVPFRFAPAWVLAGWDEQRTETKWLQGLEGLVRKQYPTTIPEQTDAQLEYGGFIKGSATRENPEVVVYLRKSLPMGIERFALELPYPDQPELAINSSELTVLADSGIRLIPDATEHEGLNVEPIIDTDDTSANRPPGQQFRYRGFQPRVRFAGGRAIRPQRILSASNSQLKVSGKKVVVQQDLDFDVRHQPASSITFAAPQGLPVALELLSSDDTSEVGTALELPERSESELASGPIMPEWSVALPHPRLGKFRVRAKYELPAPATSSTFVLKLLSIPNTEFQGHRVLLESSLAESLTPAAGSGWQIEPTPQTGTQEVTLLTNSQPTTFLPLTYNGRLPTSDTLEVDRIWVQTWLTVAGRQQRTVMRFRGQGLVRVELPSDLPSGETIEVKFDGLPTTNIVSVSGSINVNTPTMSPSNVSAEHTLELRYRLPNSMPWVQQVSADRPRLIGNEASAAVYWQLVTPIQQSYFYSPADLVKAFRTPWTPEGWRAEPALDTDELESWIGVTTVLEPTLGEQSLLFRGWADTPLQATLIRRELLVLVASAAVLSVCLAMIYIPWLRRTPVLVGGLLIAATAGLAMPELSMLVGQFGLLGGLCGLVAALLYLLVQRSVPPKLAPSTTTTELTGSQRGSTLSPLYSGPISTNAKTVTMEMTDSNV